MPVQKKGDATAEAAGVDNSAAANGAMEIETPATTAEPAVNGAATAEKKKKKKKKRSAEEAAIEVAPTDGANAAEAATPTPKKKKKEKAALNGSAEDGLTTEKKVQCSL